MTSRHHYKIVWTHAARTDLENLVDFIAIDRPMVASEILRKIRAKANELRTYPNRGRRVPELQFVPDLSIREIIIKPWRLIYRIRDNRVEILGCFDGRMDLEDILLWRLTRT